jgi:hypothetical protein
VCSEQREVCAPRRRGGEGTGRAGQSGRVLPLCVGKRKGKERERRGQRTQKAQKPKDTDWYSELLSRFGCATLHTVHTYTSHLIHTSHLTPHTHTSHSTLHTSHFTLHTSHFTLHTSHFTLHTSHFTLHTSHFTLHTTTTTTTNTARAPGCSGTSSSHPWPPPWLLPCPQRPPRPSGGVVPPAARKGLPWQNANLPTSQVRSDPERGQDAHLPLACLVGQSRFDWYRACSQGFATPPAAPDLATARFSSSQSTQQ